MKKESIDMTQGTPWKQMLRFAIPVFFGVVFQQLYSTVDSIVVGNYLGSSALAAVTSSGHMIFMIVSLFHGFAQGAGIVIARFFGAGDKDKLEKAIHTDMVFGSILGILITVVGVLITPTLLRLVDTPSEMMQEAVTYFRVYFMGLITLVIYNTCVGILQSIGDSKHPLYYLIISSLLNIALDVLFVGVFGSGVGGAALATIIAQGVSAVLCLRRLFADKSECGLKLNKLRIDGKMLSMIVGYGFPAAVQGAITSFANVVMQANINRFGVNAVAGIGAFSKIDGFAFMPIDSFTVSLATFTGQNLGAKRYDRVKEGTRFGLTAGILMAEAVGVLIFISCPILIRLFDQNPEVIAYGVQKARTQSLFYFALAATHCIASVLRGAGKTRETMFGYVFSWVVVRVSLVTIIMHFIQDIRVVNWIYPVTWSISMFIFLFYLLKTDWIHSFEKDGVSL